MEHLRDADVVYVFNRAQFVPWLRRELPDARIVLRMGNLHLRPAAGLRAADLVDCCSSFVEQELTRAVPGIRATTVTPECVTPPSEAPSRELREQARRELGVEGSACLLFVGRLVPEKGVHLLVEAVKLLRSTGRLPPVRVLIVGSAAFGTDTETAYSRGLRRSAHEVSDVVEFVGFVPPTELSRFYCGADVFVGPSTWAEPAGRTFAEAMAHAVPVIASDVGGIPETVAAGGAGVLLPSPPSATDLAEAISRLLAAPEEAAALGRAGRDFVRTNLDAAVVARQVRRVIGTP
ncbi:glycosyltransferase family 4 protein [Kineococcus sp. SYSU DK003]|uniref:glycosyltransferase family 4 protein n=1 Tax=Kineococcus sp. SYSU DK003 TaxID=3383124 RepID=UPI003D7D04F6